MSHKTRKILFYTAVAAFLAIGFVLLMYAQGYRWDFKNNKFVLAGAIYVEPLSPDDADIFINDKFTNKHSAALIKNLLPMRKYQVRIAKADYQAWEKDFEVTPGFVAEAKNVVLFPENLKTQIIWPSSEAGDFSVSPNRRLTAIKTSDSKIFISSLSGETSTTTQISFADKKKTLAISFEKNGLGWSPNSKKFLFARGLAGSGRSGALATVWYVWDSETGELVNITNLYERTIVTKQASVVPLPTKFSPTKLEWFGNDNNLLVLIGGKILEMNIGAESARDLGLSEIISFDAFENRIIALKNPDIILMIDSAVQNISALGQAKFAAQNIWFSHKEDKIAYGSDGALGVMWLKNTSEQPIKKSGDQETIYQSAGRVSDVYWHGSNEYLIFLENQSLKTVELDTREQTNIASWPETISAINYLPKDKKLFVLENGAIKSVEGEF